MISGELPSPTGLRSECSATKLILLLFIADYLCFKKYRCKLTNLVWRKMFFGPHPSNIEEIVEPVSLKNVHANINSHTICSRSCNDALDYVVKIYGGKSISELMEYIYKLDEVLNARIGDIIL